MSRFIYRLQLLLEHKEEAKKEAERELAKEEEQLESQGKLLESLRLQEQNLRTKRNTVRRDLLATPHEQQALSVQEVQQRSGYVKELGQQLEQARNDVVAQQTVVEEQELRVELAKEGVEQARREVEILLKHRSKQEERFLRAEQAKEELELDEVGNVLYATRRQGT